ncbi:hypothetical protein RFI_01351, partial [Reticulomyxa filosa]
MNSVYNISKSEEDTTNKQTNKQKDAAEKLSVDPTPVKIRLHSESEKLVHSFPVHCEGHPTSGNVDGSFKWYRMSSDNNHNSSNNSNNLSTNNKKDNNDDDDDNDNDNEDNDDNKSDNFQLLVCTTTPIFYPSIEDSGNEIACQWVPGEQSLLLYQPSNFARIGPLVKDIQI